MDQLKRMRLFVRTVETESFSRAGKAESVAQSTVSKEVAALEAHLGALLIRRSSRGLSVTEKGQEFYDFAIGMLGDLETAEARIRSGEVSAKGRLRVACSPVFSNRLIAPRLPALFASYPDLTIDMEVSERYVSLIERWRRRGHPHRRAARFQPAGAPDRLRRSCGCGLPGISG